MKFRTRTGTARIALLDGRIAIITETWEELPDDMAPAAYSLGCISEDMANIPGPDDDNGLTVESVKEVIVTMIENGEEGYFTKSGMPDKTVLNKLCGCKVEQSMFEQAWKEMQEESKES